ncbi:MAG TPA: protein kinase, partial [Polyangiaceae bacterium]|nr:protein kinase [Polyangiaceae bacterium]
MPPSIPSAAAVQEGSRPIGAVPVLPGHVIADRYEVVGVLGEGGMGIVYRCRDQSNGQMVALKRVIPPPDNLQHEYVLWFYKEARALAALDHPNIVRATDFGRLRDGSPFLAMELVSGASLHDLSHTRLAFPLIWSIIDGMLSALAHAHARGIIHGDL